MLLRGLILLIFNLKDPKKLVTASIVFLSCVKLLLLNNKYGNNMKNTTWDHFIPYPYIDKDVNAIHPKLLTFLQLYTAISIFFTLFIKDIVTVVFNVSKKYEIDNDLYNKKSKLILFFKYSKNWALSAVIISLAFIYWKLYSLTDEFSFLISTTYIIGPDFFLQFSQFYKTPATATSTLFFHLINSGINFIRCVQYVVFNGKYSYIGNSEYPVLMIAPLFYMLTYLFTISPSTYLIKRSLNILQF